MEGKAELEMWDTEQRDFFICPSVPEPAGLQSAHSRVTESGIEHCDHRVGRVREEGRGEIGGNGRGEVRKISGWRGEAVRR